MSAKFQLHEFKPILSDRFKGIKSVVTVLSSSRFGEGPLSLEIPTLRQPFPYCTKRDCGQCHIDASVTLAAGARLVIGPHVRFQNIFLLARLEHRSLIPVRNPQAT